MDYKDWTTFAEDVLPDGEYDIAMSRRGCNAPTIEQVIVCTGVVIKQVKAITEPSGRMPDFTGEDEHELRIFINNHEDGVEEYAIKEV